WLWWFGVDEWLLIQMLSDVETFLAYADGTLVGYESHTLRRYTGHLDRLAIHPQFQGQGWGRELLRFALQRMTARGVRSIGLSTQAMNERAQRLYELHGFRREPLDLRMYGRILSPQGSELLAVNHV
ncbi:MAG: GNAT family N-acetyltransferase, partial [Chloroflexi bacterium]|nr:GNAT family N-acetyltransferase [Chloroflexota bacterium]